MYILSSVYTQRSFCVILHTSTPLKKILKFSELSSNLIILHALGKGLIWGKKEKQS